MDYQRADIIKRRSLLDLVGERKFEYGQGLGSAVGGAISDKFKAKSTRLKRAFDPLNWFSKVVGRGSFGRFATTAMGRAFGRSDRDISYFGGGYRRRVSSKDPNFSTIGSGPSRPLRTNDSFADILGKMYNFMQKTSFEKTKHDEIERSFRQEQLDEDERRHKELVNAIKRFMGKKTTTTTDTAKPTGSIFDDILGWLKSVLPGLLTALLASKLLPPGFKGLEPGVKPSEKIPPREVPKAGEKIPPEESLKAGEKLPPEESLKPSLTKVNPEGKKVTQDSKGRWRDEKGRFAKAPAPEPIKPTATKVSKFGSAAKAGFMAGQRGALKAIETLLHWLNKIPGIKVLPAGVSLISDLMQIMKDMNDKENPISEEEAKRRAQGALIGAFAGYGGMELGSIIGAAAGTTVLPGWGTLIGGLGGGVLGYAAGDAMAKRLWDLFTTQQAEPPINTEEVNKKVKEMGGGVTEGGAAVFVRPMKRKSTTETPAPVNAPSTTESGMQNYKSRAPSVTTKPATPAPTPVSKTVPTIAPLPELSTAMNTQEPTVQVNNSSSVVNGRKDKVLATTTPRHRNTDLDRFVLSNSIAY